MLVTRKVRWTPNAEKEKEVHVFQRRTRQKENKMAQYKKFPAAILLALICSVLGIGTVFAGSGTIHSNFTVSLGLTSTYGWGRTGVKSPGPSYRPQVKCELQNNAGATISTNANWGSYGATSAYTSCPNTTGESPTRLWTTHMQWVNATEYLWYDSRP